jgi:hypothetical protein
MMLKKLVLAVAVIFLSVFSTLVLSDDWRIERDGNDVTMRERFNLNPSEKFRGEVDSSGDVRMRNYNGDRLRGNIDKDGYGTLRNDDGDRIRVRLR